MPTSLTIFMSKIPELKMPEIAPSTSVPIVLRGIMNGFRLWCGPCGRLMDPDDIGWSSMEHEEAHHGRDPICYDCYWEDHLDPVPRAVYSRLAKAQDEL